MDEKYKQAMQNALDNTKDASKKIADKSIELAGKVKDGAITGSKAIADKSVEIAGKVKDSATNTMDKYTKISVDVNNRMPLTIPSPILNKEELEIVEYNKKALDKLEKETGFDKAKSKVASIIPDKIKSKAKDAANSISEAEIFNSCLKIIGDSFNKLEEFSSKHTLTPEYIINCINEVTKDNDIASLDEICLARCSDIKKLVDQSKIGTVTIAATEGAATGAVGFAGIPFNLALSTFMYYRGVQTVAMYYGYDVKNDPGELEIAGEVFMKALDPKNEALSEGAQLVAKIAAFSEASILVKASNQTWETIASKGGIRLMAAQLRALSNAAAKKGLEKGATGAVNKFEQSAFRDVFEKVGSNLTQKSLAKVGLVIGAGIGAVIDSYEMNKIISYSNIFYSNRFLLEKEERINGLPIDGEAKEIKE